MVRTSKAQGAKHEHHAVDSGHSATHRLLARAAVRAGRPGRLVELTMPLSHLQSAEYDDVAMEVMPMLQESVRLEL